MHTLKVFWLALVSESKFCAAALFHDIGKPLVATLDEDGYDYSFTNHEERSYQIVKNWPFISEFTKDLIRHHYITRRIERDSERLKEGKNSSNGDLVTQEGINEMIKTYNSFSREFKMDLKKFKVLDDKAK